MITHIRVRWINDAIRSAKKRNIKWKLTEDDLLRLWNKQGGVCALSGVELSFGKAHAQKETTSASLDRIDSSKGYTKRNVQFVHKTVNMMKQSLSDEEFIQWCHLIIKHKQTKQRKKSYGKSKAVTNKS